MGPPPMSIFLLLFVHDGAPRARVVRGSRVDADHGLRLLRAKYSDGFGFRTVEGVIEPIALPQLQDVHEPVDFMLGKMET